MTEVVEWLESVRKASAAVHPLMDELHALHEARDQCVTWRTTGGVPCGGSGTHSDPTVSMATARMGELDEMIDRVAGRLNLCLDVVGECGAILAEMGEELGRNYRDVLEVYYIDCASTWTEVSEELGISRQWVLHMRKVAYMWLSSRVPRMKRDV